MDKIKIYISSRSNSIAKGIKKRFKLKGLREYLRKSLEKEKFLGEELIEVLIHENNFAPDGALDAHNASIKKIEESNIVFIIIMVKQDGIHLKMVMEFVMMNFLKRLMNFLE